MFSTINEHGDLEIQCICLQEDFKIRIIESKSLKSKGEKITDNRLCLSSTWGDVTEPPTGGEDDSMEEKAHQKIRLWEANESKYKPRAA